MERDIVSAQRKMRFIALKKTGAGTPALGGPDSNLCSVADTGTGDFLVTFPTYAAIPVVVAQTTTAAHMVRIGTITVSTVQILGFEQADGTTAADCDCEILIYGSDVTEKY